MAVATNYIHTNLLNAPQARSRGEYNSSAIEAYNSAVTSHKSGDKHHALELYGMALAQEPRMLPALQNLSLIYLEIEENDKARDMLKRWSQAEPQSARPLGLLAQLEYNAGSLETASTLLERAIALEQDDERKEQFLQNLSNIKTRLPRKAPASEKPAPTNPSEESRPQTPVKASEVRSSDKRVSDLEMKLASLKEGPEKNWTMLMLGLAYFDSKQWKEARQSFTKVLENTPENATAKEMIKALDRIQQNP